MKIVTFRKGDQAALGVKTDRGVLDVNAALAVVNADGQAGSDVPQSVTEAIQGGKEAVEALGKLVERALSAEGGEALWLDESELVLEPCVTNPGKIICIGLNYRRHAEETGAPIPQHPIVFNKFNNALTGAGHDVELPEASTQVDYEAELAIVIGRKAKHVSTESALDYVFGYCNVNDLSARDLQLRTSQWLLGKTCDGFSPLGPYLVTADEVGDPNKLEIRCTVNGELRQNSNTSDMIFYCDFIISYLSRHMTLMPGDVICTGTPEGVILGYPKERQVWLSPGDIVTVEIEKLGSLTNRMIAEA